MPKAIGIDLGTTTGTQDLPASTYEQLHNKLQTIQDKMLQMQPAKPRSDEPFESLFTPAQAKAWSQRRPELEAERRLVRAEILRRDLEGGK